MSRQSPSAPNANLLLLGAAALLATLPLVWQGYSCGHDFDFHLQSWLDAARQIRQGNFYPRWIVSAAYNAGEPRFVFYPPLSWGLGAVLTLCFPFVAAPAIFTFLALAGAGLGMHRLARHFASANAALLAATVYLANPYMLFNAVERAAYGELLAAAWMPLLFLAVLRAQPTVRGVAVPVALLWLTNLPAAVMGCYTLAVLVAIRGGHAAIFRHDGARELPPPGRFLATISGGTLLGLALPAFYLVPAAYERRYVQIALAIIPNMRFEDNFLFSHTTDEPHNEVSQAVSWLAVCLLVLTAAAAVLVLIKRRRAGDREKTPLLPAALVILTGVVAFMLVPLSTPLWRLLPELAFLQFPWRWLTVLSVVFALALALLLAGFGTFERNRKRLLFAGPVLALVLGVLGVWLYRQPCDPYGRPADVLRLFQTHHGVLPTEEYTPNGARNDFLRSDNPADWLAFDPAAYAPDTIPSRLLADPDFSDPLPIGETLSAPAPRHLTLDLPAPETLILNLRAYPVWRVTRNGEEAVPHIHRQDGLIALALPAGRSTIDIAWRWTLDQKLGWAISGLAVLLFGLSFRHRDSDCRATGPVAEA
jgi:hypothetical protein